MTYAMAAMTVAKEPPAGPGWIHEIKHDGFRIIAWRDGRSVRPFSRNGYNFGDRFPKITNLMPFDLLEFDGADLRSSPIEERKQHLAWALRERHHGIALNATYNGDGRADLPVCLCAQTVASANCK